MHFPNAAAALRGGPKVVGAVYSRRGLQAAARLRPGAVDFVELRLDLLVSELEQVARLAPRLAIPVILTVRGSREGGANALSLATRIGMLEKFLPHAAFVDLELASVKELGSIAAAARAQKIGVILSHHDFKKTPPQKKLVALAKAAAHAGADIFKIATVTKTASDVAELLGFLHAGARLPLSVMGMGRFGKVSRLLFAQAGSVLNYGFLDQAAVPGQWPALLLKKRLAELAPSDE